MINTLCPNVIHTTRNSGENVKRRQLLFARDAFRWIAGSFRRILLGPKRRWQQFKEFGGERQAQMAFHERSVFFTQTSVEQMHLGDVTARFQSAPLRAATARPTAARRNAA